MSRRDIYYWKCDRPAAFHGTQVHGEPDATVQQLLAAQLLARFGTQKISLSPTGSQGNHQTWMAEVDGVAMFVRVENGPERDGHMAVESAVLDHVRATGVPTPRVFDCDASRRAVPFAWQALELIPHPDLNHWHKMGRLDTEPVAHEIGMNVARWQRIRPAGFGPFSLSQWLEGARLSGYHERYADYFRLRLEEHLAFLVARGFFTEAQRREVQRAVEEHAALLDLEQGCLVHKDLALWNILGTSRHIHAFIDFDDAISGDPMDDLSLLGCFHDAPFLRSVLEGYASVSPLPGEHRRRFWLHLLRNMIVKAVIRVGAGYFDRSDGFFLIGAGRSGADLRTFTQERLAKALLGLRNDLAITEP